MKKEFSYLQDGTVTMELVVYGALIVTVIFGSCLFAEKLGISNMLVTALLSIVALFSVSFYLLPVLKQESHPSVITDPVAGTINKNDVTISRDDVRQVYAISYALGKKKWQVFRINGRKSIGVDTRNYPEADRLDNILSKIFPAIKIKKVQAKSPFLLISYVGVGYLVILWVVGMVI